MLDQGKKNIFGVAISVVDYASATRQLLDAAVARRPFAASAVAVHPLMTAVREPDYRYCLNRLDLLAPDGQPVRWALNLLHGVRLRERVYGPALMAETLSAAASAGVRVYFYGSRHSVLSAMLTRLKREMPSLMVVGAVAGEYRPARPGEMEEIARHIRASRADLVFVGLGAPRQEKFVHAFREKLGVPLLAVGAAFDYYAGLLRKPPAPMQRLGLEWLWRLGLEPRRLWRRYLYSNTAYVALLMAQLIGLWTPRRLPSERPPPSLIDV